MNRFVVLEGLDGAGTTTQSARLVATLAAAGHGVVATREPTGGPVGRVIRSTLRAEPDSPDVRALPWLFAADRADHLYRTVEPALASGSWVVSDRYYHSSLAYQSLTMPLAEVHALNAHFRAPDVTVFLEVPVDTCLDRISGRPEREIYEEKGRLDRVHAAYQAVLALLQARGERIVVLDGTLPPDEVEALVRAAVAAP